MPEQIWDAIKWVIIISTIGVWLWFLPKYYYMFFIEEDADKKKD